MKAILKTIQADLHNVFVMGNANERQLAKAFILLAIPLYTLVFTFGHFPLYK